jgi:hypothetical protein
MRLLSDDRTRFPLLELSDDGLALALWPTAKVQAEQWLADTAGPGNGWYEEVLAVSPRASWRHFTAAERERLLLTGARPEEAVAFCRWLGTGFDLPTAEEWRTADRALRFRRLTETARESLRGAMGHPAARALLEHLLEQQPTTWGELMLLSGGVFEWVYYGREFRGLGGRTRPEFFTCLFNPQMDDPAESLPAGARSFLFGLRPVYRGKEAPQQTARSGPSGGPAVGGHG